MQKYNENSKHRSLHNFITKETEIRKLHPHTNWMPFSETDSGKSDESPTIRWLRSLIS